MKKPDEEEAEQEAMDLSPAEEDAQAEAEKLDDEDYAAVEKWAKKDLRDRRRADSKMLEVAGVSKKEIAQLRRLQSKGKGGKVAEWYEGQRQRLEAIEEEGEEP